MYTTNRGVGLSTNNNSYQRQSVHYSGDKQCNWGFQGLRRHSYDLLNGNERLRRTHFEYRFLVWIFANVLINFQQKEGPNMFSLMEQNDAQAALLLHFTNYRDCCMMLPGPS